MAAFDHLWAAGVSWRYNWMVPSGGVVSWNSEEFLQQAAD